MAAAPRRSRKLEYDALWEYALQSLRSRAHSATELRRKLARRAQSSFDVTAVIEKLAEYGMLDDRRFSEAYATARLANDGFGPFRVLRDLRARQVDSTLAEQAVAGAFQGTDERELAEAFLRRKYKRQVLATFLSEEKNLASVYRRLRLAGFSSSVVWSVLRKYNRQAPEWEEPEATE